MNKLLIFPSSGNGLEALECVDPNLYECMGFIDDDPEKIGTKQFGLPVFDRSILTSLDEQTKVLAVIGSYKSFRNRQQIIASLELKPAQFATVIHPKAMISQNAKIGHNTLIMAGTVITSNAVIGNHCCILPNCVIHHDSTLLEYSIVSSSVSIAGNCNIGPNAYIGVGSTIKDGIQIGEKALVGSGSNVVKNIASHQTVYGNPAKPNKTVVLND